MGANPSHILFLNFRSLKDFQQLFVFEHINDSIHFSLMLEDFLFPKQQLVDEAEHVIKSQSDRGQCYLPKRS